MKPPHGPSVLIVLGVISLCASARHWTDLCSYFLAFSIGAYTARVYYDTVMEAVIDGD